MRILLVHNFYRSSIPSGENIVFRAESQLLRDHGYEVEEFTRSNDEELDAPLRTRAEAALLMPWNPRSAGRMREALARFRPDVVHVHNTFPLLSPSVVAECGRSGIPVVCTLHNYRLFCAATVALRNDRVCTVCIDRKSSAPALLYGCYNGSRLKTLPLALTIAVHRRRGTWQNNVRTFLALSEHHRERLIAAGLPGERIEVKPNFAPPPNRILPWQQREQLALFVGRLSPEKGCETLINAWLRWGDAAPSLEIIGDGPDRNRLEELARTGIPGKIRFLGRVPSEAVRERLCLARLVIQPALWLETFGMTVIEAYSYGVPVIASRIGSLASLVRDTETGFLFEPGNVSELTSTLVRCWADQQRMEQMGQKGREHYELRYSPFANLQLLRKIYDRAIASKPRENVSAAAAH